MRFGFIFGAAVMKVAVAWVVLAAACYVVRDVYLYPPGLAGWLDPSFWQSVLTLEGTALLLSGIWTNPVFVKIALGVAGLLLVWSCFVSAMLARILEQHAENEAAAAAHSTSRLQDL